MTDNRCDRCAHWDKEHGTSWEADGAGFGLCTRIRPGWEIQEEASERLKVDKYDDWELHENACQNAMIEAKAYVMDGSSYVAMLYTRPDFFCALFESSPAPQEEPA